MVGLGKSQEQWVRFDVSYFYDDLKYEYGCYLKLYPQSPVMRENNGRRIDSNALCTVHMALVLNITKKIVNTLLYWIVQYNRKSNILLKKSSKIINRNNVHTQINWEEKPSSGSNSSIMHNIALFVLRFIFQIEFFLSFFFFLEHDFIQSFFKFSVKYVFKFVPQLYF